MKKRISLVGCRQSGFTLVELIAVIVIIGILTSMISTRAADTRKEVKDTRSCANAQVLQSAFERAKVVGDITHDYPDVHGFVKALYDLSYISSTNCTGVDISGNFPDVVFAALVE